MKFCGNCGVPLRCVKTGMTVKDEGYADPKARLSADLFACQSCGALVIVTAAAPFIDEKEHLKVHAVMGGGTVTYSDDFKEELARRLQ